VRDNFSCAELVLGPRDCGRGALGDRFVIRRGRQSCPIRWTYRQAVQKRWAAASSSSEILSTSSWSVRRVMVSPKYRVPHGLWRTERATFAKQKNSRSRGKLRCGSWSNPEKESWVRQPCDATLSSRRESRLAWFDASDPPRRRQPRTVVDL